MGKGAIALMVFGALVLGMILGAIGAKWHDGTLTSTDTATGIAQGQVEEAVKDARKIDAASSEADRSEQDAQVKIRTVRVTQCPPGDGVLSGADTDELRQLLADPSIE